MQLDGTTTNKTRAQPALGGPPLWAGRHGQCAPGRPAPPGSPGRAQTRMPSKGARAATTAVAVPSHTSSPRASPAVREAACPPRSPTPPMTSRGCATDRAPARQRPRPRRTAAATAAVATTATGPRDGEPVWPLEPGPPAPARKAPLSSQLRVPVPAFHDYVYGAGSKLHLSSSVAAATTGSRSSNARARLVSAGRMTCAASHCARVSRPPMPAQDTPNKKPCTTCATQDRVSVLPPPPPMPYAPAARPALWCAAAQCTRVFRALGASSPNHPCSRQSGRRTHPHFQVPGLVAATHMGPFMPGGCHGRAAGQGLGKRAATQRSFVH